MPTRILAINSTKEVLELYHELLTAEGYETFVDTFGPTNLQEIERLMPDVLIIDYVPGRTNIGWELLQKLKMNRETANIPIIICTTQSRAIQEMEGFLASKRVAVVLKPFDIDDLLSAVKQAFTLGELIYSPEKKKEHDER